MATDFIVVAREVNRLFNSHTMAHRFLPEGSWEKYQAERAALIVSHGWDVWAYDQAEDLEAWLDDQREADEARIAQIEEQRASV